MRMLWMVLVVVVIAPLGQSTDPPQGPASATDTYLSIIAGEGPQAMELTSNPPPQGEQISQATLSQDGGSLNYSQQNVDKLLEAIDVQSQDSGQFPGRDSPGGILPNDAQSSHHRGLGYIYDQDIPITSAYPSRDINSNLLNLLEICNDDDYQGASPMENKDLGMNINTRLFDVYSERDSAITDRIASVDMDRRGGSAPHYFYEKNPREEISIPARDAAYKIGWDFDYVYGKTDATSGASRDEVHISTGTGSSDETKSGDIELAAKDQPANPFLSALPNLDRIRESSTSGPDAWNASSIVSRTHASMQRIGQDDSAIYDILKRSDIALQDDAGEFMPQIEDMILRQGRSRSSKNYAVVIGINSYSDRMPLHTSVNDADKMAALLESYGYQVIKLTDQTKDLPTKSNILEKALGELKDQKDLGKVLIYFSGHGEMVDDDYYLIPQDSDGRIGSYISAEELEGRIQGLKSVALVVDACNSGELEKVADDGQLVLASSRRDQPSNEVWFGPLSLFTSNLYNAIKEEEKVSNAVVLERCFYKAQEATEKWSKWRLVDQTPQMKDRSGGFFYLN